MDIVLTGIPRSGTTLTCSLLNRLAQCVALHEPMLPHELAALDFPLGYLQGVDRFFASQRASLLVRGTAITKARDGGVPDNPFGSSRDGDGRRQSSTPRQEVRFDKGLRPGFRLVIKHPSCFTATLPTLCARFPCFAVIRNPLGVLLSWQSIRANVQGGRVPAAEAFDGRLRSSLDGEPDRLERQVIILRWFLARYAACLSATQVIRYEDLVSSRGQALAAIDPAARQLNAPLESRNANPLYEPSLVHLLADRLLSDESIFSHFYAASEIRQLRDRWS